MKYATLRLSKENDSTDYFDLKYKIIDNDFTRKWINCVLEAQQKQYNISEPWALYNINDRLNSDFVLKNLNDLMDKVDSEEVLFGFRLETINDQDKLNKIHSIFELYHGKLDQWKDNPIFHNKTPEFRKNLSEINQFVHACESSRGDPKIRIVWFDLPKVHEFTNSDYKLFTNKRKFGSLYHLYSDVGKGIESLAVDDDEHHHDIVPNIHFSADCIAYFCTDEDDAVKKSENKMQDYILKHREYLQNQGYPADDIRLTTGRIELARLENVDEASIMENIKKYDYIQSFNLT
tara:strand:- start:236 stop:1108 length:873 start_codon:yes stop_codon:yes gene_type:complete